MQHTALMGAPLPTTWFITGCILLLHLLLPAVHSSAPHQQRDGTAETSTPCTDDNSECYMLTYQLRNEWGINPTNIEAYFDSEAFPNAFDAFGEKKGNTGADGISAADICYSNAIKVKREEEDEGRGRRRFKMEGWDDVWYIL